MILHKADLQRQAITKGNVVGVHSRDVSALRHAAPSVQGFDQPSVLLVKDSQP
jgi:hypothetical protein